MVKMWFKTYIFHYDSVGGPLGIVGFRIREENNVGGDVHLHLAYVLPTKMKSVLQLLGEAVQMVGMFHGATRDVEDDDRLPMVSVRHICNPSAQHNRSMFTY